MTSIDLQAGSTSARINARCHELAGISAQADGLTRLYLTDEHRRVNQLVARWMSDAGMQTRVDAVGNLIGRYEAKQSGMPALVLGSHLDSVRDAGRYDGPLGVMVAIACVEALHERDLRLDFAIEVVGFADEEGVRFPAAMIGSRGFSGALDTDVLDCRDGDGHRLDDALRHFGLDPAGIASATRRRDELLGYLEVHIEQGPVLQENDLPLGVVSAIAGTTRLNIHVSGCAGHAGTVPMNDRRDAVAGAAECISALENEANAAGIMGTVGQIHAAPGAVNVIAGDAMFSVDLRSEDDARRVQALARLEARWQAIAARRRLTLDIETTHDAPACACAPWLIEHLAEQVQAADITPQIMVSGAGHDAAAVAEITDIGMLFVRCRDGISHHPDEAVREDDIDLAARVLRAAIERFPSPPTARQ